MKGLTTGLRKHPLKAFAAGFAAFSVCWTLIACCTYVIPSLNLRGTFVLAGIVIVSLVYAAFRVWQPSQIEITVRHTNTKIEVKFGDLFAQDGYRAIAVSEFFESELGIPVSEKSLHGLFLKKCFGGHPQSFDTILSSELHGIPGIYAGKQCGKTQKYPIGTTALVPLNNDHYLCFALCETDISTCKAHADVPTLWLALQGLWQKARTSLGGAPLVLPLVGSGLSGVGLDAKELLDLIILSIIAETKRQQIATRICIVLAPDRFEEIDLRKTAGNWR